MAARLLRADDPAALAAAIAAIRGGGLVALPTETVYGVACALDAAALARLVAAKGRPAEKGVTLHLAELEQALEVALMAPAARRLAERFWPGPLTLVLPIRPGVELPDLVVGASGHVGLRVPDMAAPRALSRALGPLPISSANRSGEPPATTAAAAAAALGDALALILDGGPSRAGIASTVVAFADDTTPRILRPGALVLAEIEAALRR